MELSRACESLESCGGAMVGQMLREIREFDDSQILRTGCWIDRDSGGDDSVGKMKKGVVV